ncbi:M15 family metallopeptidase [Microbulbifer sp. PAAF003]|uniref:M15 family metallopeptidase n=1 Tax=Microbulbifer sp. PAAF003 TaxID=3243375 RepID=UPI00403A5B64
MYKKAIAAIAGLVLFACTKDQARNIDVNDFEPEAKTGIYDISQEDCELMRLRQVLRSNSPIGCERLKRVVFNYVPLLDTPAQDNVGIGADLDRRGAVVVLDIVAKNVLSLFGEIYRSRFPIQSAIPVEYFTLQERMADDRNNTLAFDSRPITGGSRWSEHAYGVAIDINPLQNPYLYIDKHTRAKVIPKDATEGYLNRAKFRPGKPTRMGMSEDVTTIFARHGFVVWGGDWNVPIDYMHFQVGSRQFINRLVTLPKESAKQLFNRYTQQLNLCFEESNSIKSATHLRKHCVDKVVSEFDGEQE